MIAAVVRMPEEEYKQYRRLALEEGKSFAELVRHSLKNLKKGESHGFKDKKIINKKLEALRWLSQNRVTTGVSAKELIEEVSQD